ncbi:indolepyruvate oxidoreductase subunit beta [Candidatus Poribacteria bacterium]|nr:indolepyruvate oxidoreductase subunit beta [Candidatus Poribacteria bacterium]
MTVAKMTNVLAAGVGGQGIIRQSDILAQVAFEAGFDVKKSEIHGLSQRGGSVTSHVRWGEKVYSPVIMDGEADFLLALEELEALRNAHLLKPGGVILLNEYRLLPATVIANMAEYPAGIDEQLREFGLVVRVPANDLAQRLGNLRAANTILLGALSHWLNLPAEAWDKVLRSSFPEKHLDLNLKAFEMGRGHATAPVTL